MPEDGSEPLQIHTTEVVGYYLLQPIVDLLVSLHRVDEDHVHSPVTLESGYAASIVALSFTLLESFLEAMRRRWPNEPPRRRLHEFLGESVGRDDLVDHFDELQAVRNAVLHSHQWNRSITFDVVDGVPRQVAETSFELEGGFGDRTFHRVVHFESNTTRILELPIIPTRLRTGDVIRYLRVSFELLLVVEELLMHTLGEDRVAPNVGNQWFQGDSGIRRVTDLLEELRQLDSR